MCDSMQRPSFRNNRKWPLPTSAQIAADYGKRLGQSMFITERLESHLLPFHRRQSQCPKFTVLISLNNFIHLTRCQITFQEKSPLLTRTFIISTVCKHSRLLLRLIKLTHKDVDFSQISSSSLSPPLRNNLGKRRLRVTFRVQPLKHRFQVQVHPRLRNKPPNLHLGSMT